MYSLKLNNYRLSSSVRHQQVAQRRSLRAFQGGLWLRLTEDRLYQTVVIIAFLHHNTCAPLHSLSSNLWHRHLAYLHGHRRHKQAMVVPKHSTRVTILNNLAGIPRKVYHLLVWAPPQDLPQWVDLLHCLRLLGLHLGRGGHCRLALDPHQAKPYQECLPDLEVNQGHILLGFNRMAMGEVGEKIRGIDEWVVLRGCDIKGLTPGWMVRE